MVKPIDVQTASNSQLYQPIKTTSDKHDSVLTRKQQAQTERGNGALARIFHKLHADRPIGLGIINPSLIQTTSPGAKLPTLLRCGWGLAMGLALSTYAHAADVHSVGQFDPKTEQPSTPWQLINFDDDVPTSTYANVEWDGVNAVEGIAQASMALLARPLDLDLLRTPILCWRWRVDHVVAGADLRQKSGDDYAARVYVAFNIPSEDMSFGLRAKLRVGRMLFGDQVPDAAINYVWDNRHPVGTKAPNAYTDRVQTIVARSGNGDADQWQTEWRDVLADAVAAFPDVRLSAISLAIGTDTDNTGESTRAGFADLHFVGQDKPCQFPSLRANARLSAATSALAPAFLGLSPCPSPARLAGTVGGMTVFARP